MKTYSHPDLFAVAKERQAAALESLTMIEDRINPSFTEAALESVRVYALTHEYFLAEEISVNGAHDNRIMGAIIRKAVKAGWIEKCGYGPAVMSNLSPKVRCKSLIYTGDAA